MKKEDIIKDIERLKEKLKEERNKNNNNKDKLVKYNQEFEPLEHFYTQP